MDYLPVELLVKILRYSNEQLTFRLVSTWFNIIFVEYNSNIITITNKTVRTRTPNLSSSNGDAGNSNILLATDTSSGIRQRVTSNSGMTWTIQTLGWVDFRGKE